MKRVLSLVLALVMVLGMIPMGFAADQTAGEILKGYELLAGDENGNLNEDQYLNRAEMMVILARMNGKYEEAKSFALPSSYTDLAGFGWAVPYIAYAELNEWTSGVGAGKFDPAGHVTLQMAAYFMVEALGYADPADFSWTTAVEKATSLGLLAGIQANAGDHVLRGDLFKVMLQTLNTNVKGKEVLLGSELGVKGFVPPVVVPATLEVSSVTATNLNQVKVVFTQEVDKASAEDETNYSIDGVALTTDSVAKLQSDNKTVLITLDVAKAQYQKVVVGLTGIVYGKDALKTVPKVDFEVIFSDVTVPTLKSASTTGNKIVTVEYSEPVLFTSTPTSFVATNFKINGQSVTNFGYSSASVLSSTDSGYATKIELVFAVALPAGTHTLTGPAGTSSDLIDAAGFKVVSSDVAFTVDSVTNAPKVVEVTGQNNGTVYVTFDRAINSTDAADNTLFSVNGYTASGAAFVSNTGSKQIKLTFGTGEVAKGLNILVIDKDLRDSFGNDLDPDNDLRISFNATEDTTKPVVSSVVMLDSDTIRVKYSETVNAVYARNIANYTIKNSSGVTQSGVISSIDPVSADNNGNSDIFDITIVNTYTVANGDTLTIKNVEDLAATPNKIDEYKVTLSVKDTNGPTAEYAVKVSNTKVAIFFDEAMDAASITNKANINFRNGLGEWKALPSSATVTAADNNKTAIVTFPSPYVVLSGAANQYDVQDIRVANVKDAAGNVLDDLVAILDIQDIGTAVNQPELSEFVLKTSGSNVVAELEFDQVISALVKDDFQVEGYTADSAYVSGYKVVLTFSASAAVTDIKAAGPAASVSTETEWSKNAYEIAIAPIDAYVVDDEQIKPAIVSGGIVATNGAASDYVVITFTEAIDGDYAVLYRNDFVFEANGKVLTVVGNPEVNGNDLTFHFATGSFATGDNVKVKAQTTVDIRDLEDLNDDYNLYAPTSTQRTGITVIAIAE